MYRYRIYHLHNLLSLPRDTADPSRESTLGRTKSHESRRCAAGRRLRSIISPIYSFKQHVQGVPDTSQILNASCGTSVHGIIYVS